MGEIKDKAEELTEHVGEYLDTFIKLTTISATGKVTGMLSAGITSIVVMLFMMFAMLFAFMGIGWWLGEQMHNMLAGFSIVSGFYLLLILLILVFRKSFLFPLIRNVLIRKIYE